MSTPTTHNPKNFQPQDYRVLTYLDNRMPEYVFPMGVREWAAAVEAWKADWQRFFPEQGAAAGCRCCHCGNGTIRYAVVCRHTPSGENVVLGDICVDRLQFADHDHFKATMVRRAAETTRKRLQMAAKAKEWLEARPSLRALVENLQTDPAQADNAFAHDVVAKLIKYGSLTEKQEAALAQSPQRHLDRKRSAAEKEAERERLLATCPPWQAGLQEVTGTIITVKVQEGFYGTQVKCLIQLQDGRKCWGTKSTKFPEAGELFTFTAVFSKSDNDPLFAFYSKPKQIRRTQA